MAEKIGYTKMWKFSEKCNFKGCRNFKECRIDYKLTERLKGGKSEYK